MSEHDSPGDADADLTPVSHFFPTIAPEESRTLDGETLTIAARRVRVVEMYCRRMSMRAIADELKCALGTVHRDLHIVWTGYREVAKRSLAQHLTDALLSLAHREAELEIDLQRSRGDRTETTTGRNATANGDYNRATVKKRQAFGDPKIHGLLLKCWEHRCKLLGLLKDADLKDKNELPPVKLVAGLDPTEVV